MVFRGKANISHPYSSLSTDPSCGFIDISGTRVWSHQGNLTNRSVPKEIKGELGAYCWRRPTHSSLHPQVTWLPCASFHFPAWPRHVSTARTGENPPGCSSWAWTSWMNEFHCESRSQKGRNKVVRCDDKSWVHRFTAEMGTFGDNYRKTN